MNNLKSFKAFSLNESTTTVLSKEQEAFLDKHTEGSWSINPNTGDVNIKGAFNMYNLGYKDFLEITFGEISGKFDCSRNKLTTLKGAPKKAGEDFYCYSNKLQTLEGSPEEVGGYFDCYDNKLQTLEGAPKKVGGSFDCYGNKLTTLKGAPEEVGKNFYCYGNELTTLKGAPEKVGKSFDCSNNELQTLKGAPEKVEENFYCFNNKLQTLKGAPKKVGENFYCLDNKLQTLEGAPKKVGGHFDCSRNELQTLKGAPEEVGEEFSTDDFSISGKYWTLEWKIENVYKFPILLTIYSPEDIQELINENPGEMVMKLKSSWTKLKNRPEYSEVKFPEGFEDSIEMTSDLSDLGIL